MTQEISNDVLQVLKSYTDDGYVFDDTRLNFVNRWSYILMQLAEAKNFLELAEKNSHSEEKSNMPEILLQEALFRSFVISYAKCFSSSGKGRLSLDKKEIFKDEGLIVHERIMEVRNKFVAHSDESDIDTALLAVKELDDHILIKHTYTISHPLNEYESYKEAIEVVERAVVLKLNKALDSIQEKEGKAVLLG